jgi:hypothetical protein
MKRVSARWNDERCYERVTVICCINVDCSWGTVLACLACLCRDPPVTRKCSSSQSNLAPVGLRKFGIHFLRRDGTRSRALETRKQVLRL